MAHFNRYYDSEFVSSSIRQGRHRGVVGGLWDKIGRLQFDYVRDHGLEPGMQFLDIGCGCLRGGVHFVRYLEPGRYHGIDLSQSLLDAGYDVELADGELQHKLPRGNLRQSAEFEIAPFGTVFDMALALSVFTHLPLNHLKLCLARLAPGMRPGGRFFASVFNCPDGHDWTEPLTHDFGTTYPHQDPFHYRRPDLEFCTSGLPWQLDVLEQWSHPRNQWMAVFTRLEDPA